MEETALCVIMWNDTKETEEVLISIDGHDNDHIFFVCNSEKEFKELCKTGFGEFEVIEYENITRL